MFADVAAAIVTGASRGIGRAVAVELARAGFAVGLIARSSGGLDETRELIEQVDGRTVAACADIVDPQAVRDAVEAIEGSLGDLSALVNNAGTMHAIGPLWEVGADDWWADVRSSLGGAFNLCRELIPRLLDRGGGRIVNVTSYAGVRPAPYQTAYGSAKAALVSLTESLAASLDEHGVKVFAVAPGFTDTEMTRRLTESPDGRRWLPEVGSGRVVPVERTAQLIVSLLRGEADSLSGRVIHTLDDLGELTARVDEVRRDELYVPRVRRLPGA